MSKQKLNIDGGDIALIVFWIGLFTYLTAMLFAPGASK